MNKPLAAFCFLLIVTAFAGNTNAQQAALTYVSQTRTVEYRRATLDGLLGINTVQFDQVISNNTLDPFNQTLQGIDFIAVAPNDAQTFIPGLAPAATQTSTINFNSIVASGSYNSFLEVIPFGFGLQDRGETSLNVVFDLAGPAAYSIDLSATGPTTASLFRTLPSGALDLGFTPIDANNGTVSQSGILDPGRYTVAADNALSSDFVGAPVGSFDINFQVDAVPEPSTFVLLLGIGSSGLTLLRRRTI